MSDAHDDDREKGGLKKVVSVVGWIIGFALFLGMGVVYGILAIPALSVISALVGYALIYRSVKERSEDEGWVGSGLQFVFGLFYFIMGIGGTCFFLWDFAEQLGLI